MAPSLFRAPEHSLMLMMLLPFPLRPVLLVLFVVVLPLVALDALASPAKQPGAELHITVRDTHGQPVEAQVQAVAFDPDETVEEALERGWRTDQPLSTWEAVGTRLEPGSYRILNVPARRIWVSAFAHGHYPGEAEATVDLKAGETRELVLTLEPARTLQGRLVNAQGNAIWIGKTEADGQQHFGFHVSSVRLRASYLGVSRPALHEGETLHAAWQLHRQRIVQRARMLTPIQVDGNVDGQVGAFRLGNLDPKEDVELEVLLLPHGPRKTLEVSLSDEPQTVALPAFELGHLEATLRRYDGTAPSTGTVTLQRTDEAISTHRFALDDPQAPYDAQRGLLAATLPAGEYELAVTAKNVREARARVTVRPAATHEVALELGAMLPFAVRVVTQEGGEAIAGASVEPVGVQTPWMRRILAPHETQSRRTDEHGRATFEPLAYAQIILRVGAEGYESRVVQADLLAHDSDSPREHVITLAPQRTGEVQIKRHPPARGGRSVVLSRADDSSWGTREQVRITLDSDGFGVAEAVPVGEWTVRCPRSGENLFVTIRETSPALVELGGPLFELPLELHLRHNGGPLQDLLFVSVRGRDVGVRERVEPNRDRFTTRLPPGTHELFIGTSDRRNLFPGDPVRFFRLPLTVENGIDGTLQREINLPARTLRGVVRNAAAAPVPRAMVMAVAAESPNGHSVRQESQWPRLSTTTDAQGRFTLRGLEEDTAYRVWAQLMHPTPEFAEHGQGVAVHALTATNSQAEPLELTLATGGRVEVSLDEYGPLNRESVKLHLRDKQGHTMPQTLPSDHDVAVYRRVVIPFVPPGQYVLQVEVEGHAYSRHKLQVAENETVQVTATARPEGVLLVRLADDAGAPLAAGAYTMRNEAGEDVTPLRRGDALFGPNMRAEPHLLPLRNLAAGTYEVEVTDITGQHHGTLRVNLEASTTKEVTLTLR